jgi:hypothetical protein
MYILSKLSLGERAVISSKCDYYKRNVMSYLKLTFSVNINSCDICYCTLKEEILRLK